MLLLVFLLMVEAGKPRHWQWLFREPAATQGLSTASRASNTSPDASSTIGDTSLSGGDLGLLAGSHAYLPGIERADIESLQDNTAFLPEETDIWYRWLNILRQANAETLASASIHRVGYVQVFRQTEGYRGKLVRVKGTVRRAHYIKAPENSAHIEGYWQCWLFPEGRDAGGSPIVVYALQMPPGFPEGMQFNEPAEFVGLVYKRWAYPATLGPAVAPLLLANTGQWAPQPKRIDRPSLPGTATFLGAIVVTALLGVGIAWTVNARSRAFSNTSQTRGPANQFRPENADRLRELGELPDVRTQLRDLADRDAQGRDEGRSTKDDAFGYL